ncbi:hypothetical protein KQI65_17940, partial [bacterium]|nr:hypothetical protein [bacterium]
MRRIYFIVCVFLLLAGSTALAAELEVGAGKTYTTIQAAIDAASAGDIIKVFPGAYDETATGRTPSYAAASYQFGLFIDKDDLVIKGVDASGNDITSYGAVAASIKTNATNSFGYSGIFVDADGVSIIAMELLDNYIPTGVSNNKTIEVVGDDFTIKHCMMSVSDGGCVYIGDELFDDVNNVSYIQQYRIEANYFDNGGCVAIVNGSGYTGALSGKLIVDNVFTGGGSVADWYAIGFSGSGGVPWYVHPTGGATVAGNTFEEHTEYIKARGTVDEASMDWLSWWQNNSFVNGVITLQDEAAFTPRPYSYPSGTYTFINVRRIASVIQKEIDVVAQNGDAIHAKPGTYDENLAFDVGVKLFGEAGAAATVLDGLSLIQASGVTIQNFTLTNAAGNYAVNSTYGGLTIQDNIVTQVGNTVGGNVHAVHVALDRDNISDVVIKDNSFSQIGNATGGSTSAIGLTQRSSINTLTNLLVQGNTIADIDANPALTGGKGVYGILLGVGGTGGGTIANAKILNNNISDLSGKWAHAIGLEGNTPNALVLYNTISQLSSSNVGTIPPTPPNLTFSDAVAIKLEENSYANTVTISYNNIGANLDAGIINSTPQQVMAELNWWDDADGPIDIFGTTEVDLASCGSVSVADMLNIAPAAGLGTIVMGDGLVDYCPWLGSSVSSPSIAIASCPVQLTVANPSVDVPFVYSDGPIDALFGYSLIFKYDPTVVSVDLGDITEGSLLGSSTLFNKQKLSDEIIGGVTYERVRIDASRLNQSSGGVSGPGTLFSVEFDAVADCGQTDLLIEILNVRDPYNAPIYGVVATDCAIDVDILAPTVENVLIANTTVQPITGSHEYAKD